MIQSTTVTTDKNPSFDTPPGNNTTDKVFLLSITEADKYFSSDGEKKCAPTSYAKAQGADTYSDHSVGGKAPCKWWLRSLGRGSNYAAFVAGDGSVNDYGDYVIFSDIAVRPAMWVSLK